MYYKPFFFLVRTNKFAVMKDHREDTHASVRVRGACFGSKTGLLEIYRSDGGNEGIAEG